MTRAEIRQQMRFILNELGVGWLTETSSTEFDANQAVTQAYNAYAVATKCFPVNYNLAATADKHTYAYRDFGTSSAGARIFELKSVYWDYEGDQKRLARATEDQMETHVSDKWQFYTSGTPDFWIPYGTSSFRIWRPAPDTKKIYIEGWEIPDPADFDEDTDVPEIHEIDHDLLAIKAALIVIPRDMDTARLQIFRDEWETRTQKARNRIHGSGGEEIVFARNATLSNPKDTITYDTTIVNIT